MRDHSVKNCHGFDKHSKGIHPSHLRTGLCRGHAFLREVHESATSSQKREAMFPPESFLLPVKGERSSLPPLYDHPTLLSPSMLTLSLHTLLPPVALALELPLRRTPRITRSESDYGDLVQSRDY